MSALYPFTNDELYKEAPTLFTQEPHYEVSDKYHFIPTIEVVDEIRQHNWHPVSVQEASVRDLSKEGYQRHYVRFRHISDLLRPKENSIELLLFNSHDRTSAFSISAGVYRFVCANGLVVANNTFDSYKIKHLGNRASDVTEAVHHISTYAPKLKRRIDDFSAIGMNESEKLAFAEAALPLRFEEQHFVEPKQLLVPHREADEKNDLYTVFNVVQENLIRGNLKGHNRYSGRAFTSKPVKSIQKDVSINKGLWELTEHFARIKEPMGFAA